MATGKVFPKPTYKKPKSRKQNGVNIPSQRKAYELAEICVCEDENGIVKTAYVVYLANFPVQFFTNKELAEDFAKQVNLTIESRISKIVDYLYEESKTRLNETMIDWDILKVNEKGKIY